jgi:outer membrane protein
MRMSQPRRADALWSVLCAVSAALSSAQAAAQAPASPDKPWPIPQDVIRRAQPQFDVRGLESRKRYGLVDLIDLAQRNNPQTRAAWEAAREAATAEGLVESSYLPQISLQALGGLEHTPLPAPKNLVPEGFFVSNTREIIPSVALKWLLFDFGQRKAKLEAARADSFVANVSFTGIHQSLIFQVSQAYFDLGAARGRLRAAQTALKTALTTQDATTAKRNNGLATIVSVAQAQRQTAQARYGLTAAQGAERNTYAGLIASLGIPADTELDVVDSDELPLPTQPVADVSAAIRDALANRPDVIAAIGKVDAARASLDAEQRSRYPVIDVSAHGFQNAGWVSSDGKPYSSVDRPGGNILFSFSVPLFDGGLRSSRISMARSQVREAEAKLDQTRDTAAQQVVKAYNGLVTSLGEFEAATELSRAAHTAYDAALRSYRQGVGTYTDVATEENAVAQAETQVEDARASSHTAAAALAFAMGTPESAQSPLP